MGWYLVTLPCMAHAYFGSEPASALHEICMLTNPIKAGRASHGMISNNGEWRERKSRIARRASIEMSQSPHSSCSFQRDRLPGYMIYKNQSPIKCYLILYHATPLRGKVTTIGSNHIHTTTLAFLLSVPTAASLPLPDRYLTLSNSFIRSYLFPLSRLQLLLDFVRRLLTRFTCAISRCTSGFLHVVSSLLPLIFSLFAATSCSNL